MIVETWITHLRQTLNCADVAGDLSHLGNLAVATCQTYRLSFAVMFDIVRNLRGLKVEVQGQTTQPVGDITQEILWRTTSPPSVPRVPLRCPTSSSGTRLGFRDSSLRALEHASTLGLLVQDDES